MWTVLGILVSCLFGAITRLIFLVEFQLEVYAYEPTYDPSHEEPTDEKGQTVLLMNRTLNQRTSLNGFKA